MLRVLRTNTAVSVFITSLIMVVLLIPLFFISPAEIPTLNYNGPLAKSLNRLFPWINLLFVALGYMIACYYANFVAVKNGLVGRENRMVALFFTLLTGLGILLIPRATFVLVLLLLVRLFDRFFEIQKSTVPNKLMFDASFIIGILTCIYYPLALLLIWVWFAALYAGRFTLKAWLLSLFTLAVSVYVVSSCIYLFDYFMFDSEWYPLYFDFSGAWGTLGVWIVLIFLLLLSFPAYLEASRLNKVVVRNHLNLLLWSHLLLALLGLLLGLDGVAYAAILAFPLSVSYGQLYLRSNKLRLLEISLWVLVGCAVGFQYYRVFMV